MNNRTLFRKETLKSDAVAGVVLGVESVPDGLAGGLLAGVMAMQPEILVLDEPTSNLDPASRTDLTAILDSLDVTRLIVTHDLLYALEVCERPVIIDAGRIVADGPTREVLGDTALLAEHRLGLPAGLRIDDVTTP